MHPLVHKLHGHMSQLPPVCEKMDAASILDLIYRLYADLTPTNSDAIRSLFDQMDEYLEPLDLDQNNRVFDLVCDLCCQYEKQAFLDGLHFGVLLSAELDALSL